MGKYHPHKQLKSFNSIFLNSIPDHWEVKPLYALCKFRQGKAHEPFVDEDGEFICVNSRFVSTGGNKVKYCARNLTPAKLHDVLMVMSDLPNGRALAKGYIVVDERKYAVNQRVCSISAEKVDAKFLYYQLDRSPYFLRYDDGANQTHLSNAAFLKYPVLLPPANEQYSIAAFLDHETAKIDRLIARQELLIELLKEKRQAEISHAVTKGLNPDAPMKDSGVEWLGEVPAHWVICKLRYKITLLDHLRIPLSAEERGSRQGEYPYYGASGVIDYVDDYLFDEPLILVCEDGWNLLLRSQKVARPIEGKVWVNNHAHILRVKDIDPIFLSEMIEQTPFEILVSGMRQPKLTAEGLKDLYIACPTNILESAEIGRHIRATQSRYSKLMSKSELQIQLLREHRTALISAAVTGKIDVRGWQKPDTEREETATAVSA